jgi:hypothetical protein
LPHCPNSKHPHYMGPLRRTLFSHSRYQPRYLSLPNRMRTKTHRNLGQMRNSATKRRKKMSWSASSVQANLPGSDLPFFSALYVDRRAYRSPPIICFWITDLLVTVESSSQRLSTI